MRGGQEYSLAAFSDPLRRMEGDGMRVLLRALAGLHGVPQFLLNYRPTLTALTTSHPNTDIMSDS